jgi:2,3-bisphosphoglycerate-independent phosphoglycerate mutase
MKGGMMKHHNRCMLFILDGWGVREDRKGNAVAQAKTPFLDKIRKQYPCSQLLTFGNAVGLPDKIMGNSEVGHLNIGAGRVVYQNLMRIDKAIEDGSFFENNAISRLMERVKKNRSKLHLMGLVSDGGVHSQLTHLFALLDMARRKQLKQVVVHAILDGRDTPPTNGVKYLSTLQSHIQASGFGAIASICGRFYAMDRDKRWDRIEKAFRLYTRGQGVQEIDPIAAINSAYQKNETDEFINPIVMVEKDGTPRGTVKTGDGILFFNFRADRAREITRVLTDKTFNEFERNPMPDLCGYTCMTLFDENFSLPIAFEPVYMVNILGEIISKNDLRQLRIAETEKYAHVTYFFNGGREEPFEGEDRCLVPSPRNVSTYDQKPEMSALEVTQEVIHRIASDNYDLIVLNFANMDMVGHTGMMPAAIKACETIDHCVEKIMDKLLEKQWAAIVTADHGNAEKMIDEEGNPYTAHTVGRVRCILVDETRTSLTLKDGALCDIAPTILEIMKLDQPAEMTGSSLLLDSD